VNKITRQFFLPALIEHQSEGKRTKFKLVAHTTTNTSKQNQTEQGPKWRSAS